MELSALSKNIVSIPYERNGETDDLSVNIDIFTPEFFREVGKRFAEKMKGWQAEDKKKGKGKKGEKQVDSIQFFEEEARALEIKREIYADLLSNGVLVDWTVTENSVPVAPTRKLLLTLSPQVVQELWETCIEATKTVKKRVESETGGTLGSTQDGLPGLRVVGQNT